MSEGGSCWLLTGASDVCDAALGDRHQVCLLTFYSPSKHHLKLKSSALLSLGLPRLDASSTWQKLDYGV